MKKWVPVLMGLLVSGSLTGCGTSVANTNKTFHPVNITVSYQANFAAADDVAVAIKEGYFKKAGLNVKAIQFSGGPPELQALAGGRLDFAFVGPGPAFQPMKGNGTIIGINDFSVADRIMVSGKSGIKSVKQLKGKSVLYAAGTSGQMILDLALHNAGLSTKDVHLINIPNPGALVSAFLSGRAPAVATWSPFSTQIRKHAPSVRVIASDLALFPKVALPDVWIASAQMIKKPAVVKRFMWALMKANDYTIAHQKTATQVIASFTHQSYSLIKASGPPSGSKMLSASRLVKDYKNGTATHWFTALGKMFVSMGVLHHTTPTSKYLNLSFAEAAAKHLKKNTY